MTSKLYTEGEIDYERVFEIRVRDLKKRNGDKQKSFSLLVKGGTKDNEYIPLDELRNKLEKLIKENF